jgi:energy-converting hydrogenase Eha subunit A
MTLPPMATKTERRTGVESTTTQPTPCLAVGRRAIQKRHFVDSIRGGP